MKKTIIPIAAILMTSLSLISCGGNEHKTDAGTTTDSLKTETVPVVEVAIVKDFKYYEGLTKAIAIDGLTLYKYNAYIDSASKNFSYVYQVTNKEVGVDQIVITAGQTKNVMDKYFDASYASLAGYTTYIKDLFKTEKEVKISDYKEYKKGGATFHYFSYTKPVKKGSFDNKYFHNVSAQYVPGEVYMGILVSITDEKGDPAKAEAVLKQVADYLAK